MGVTFFWNVGWLSTDRRWGWHVLLKYWLVFDRPKMRVMCSFEMSVDFQQTEGGVTCSSEMSVDFRQTEDGGYVFVWNVGWFSTDRRWEWCVLLKCRLTFDRPKRGDDVFFWNVSWLSTDRRWRLRVLLKYRLIFDRPKMRVMCSFEMSVDFRQTEEGGWRVLLKCRLTFDRLKMRVTCSSEMSVDFWQNTWYFIPEDRNLLHFTFVIFWLYLIQWVMRPAEICSNRLSIIVLCAFNICCIRMFCFFVQMRWVLVRPSRPLHSCIPSTKKAIVRVHFW
jgi:hypothetical protein